MAGDDDIDWTWAEQPLPQVPAATPAAQLEALVAEDEIKEAAKRVEYDIKAFAVPSPFECKDALKHLGCKWTGKVWVARDAAMHVQAMAIVDKHTGRNSSFARKQKRCGTTGAQPQYTAAPAVQKKPSGLPNGAFVGVNPDGTATAILEGPNPFVDVEQMNDEHMVSELTRRGYTVAKLGETETLAQVLAALDEEDPFEAVLKELEQ